MQSDQKSKDGIHLISDIPGKHDNPHALFFFLLLHFSYIFVLFMSGLNLYLKGFLILGLILVALYFTNTQFAWTLIGIQLNFDKTKSFPAVSISSRTFPFVASTINSNSFWLTLFAITILLFFVSIYYLFSPSKIYGLLLLTGFISHVINLHFYIKGHNEAKDEADAAARSMLLDATVAFQTVDKNLSDDEDEKKQQTIEEQQQQIALSMHRSSSSHNNGDPSSQKIQVPPQFAGKPISQQNHPIPLPLQNQQQTQINTNQTNQQIQQQPQPQQTHQQNQITQENPQIQQISQPQTQQKQQEIQQNIQLQETTSTSTNVPETNTNKVATQPEIQQTQNEEVKQETVKQEQQENIKPNEQNQPEIPQ